MGRSVVSEEAGPAGAQLEPMAVPAFRLVLLRRVTRALPDTSQDPGGRGSGKPARWSEAHRSARGAGGDVGPGGDGSGVGVAPGGALVAAG